MEVKDLCSAHSPFDNLSILDLIHLELKVQAYVFQLKYIFIFPPLPFSFERYPPHVEENNPILH